MKKGEILAKVLTDTEYQIFMGIYIDKTMRRAETKRKLGSSKLDELLDSTVCKIFSNQEATTYIRHTLNNHMFYNLRNRYLQVSKMSIVLQGARIENYLNSLSLKEQMIAKYHLGIGTGEFWPRMKVLVFMKHKGISILSEDIIRISNKIVGDMCADRFRQGYLELVENKCSGNLKDRILQILNVDQSEKKQNILQQILTNQEYSLIFSLCFANSKKAQEALEEKIGAFLFRFVYHSAIRKIFQNQSASVYMLEHVTSDKYGEFLAIYNSLSKSYGAFDDKNNSSVHALLSDFSSGLATIAENHLGIGSGKFIPISDLVDLPTDCKDESNYDAMLRQILEEIVKRGFTEDYLRVLMRCPDQKFVTFIVGILEDLSQRKPAILKRENSTPNVDREEFERMKERQRLTSNLRSGYLFCDTFLNVSELSEEKSMTIKRMTHHEGLLRMSKRSNKIGGMSVFLAIAIFINFENDEQFTLTEISFITGLSQEEVRHIVHTKIQDFILLMPDVFRQENAQKLSLLHLAS